MDLGMVPEAGEKPTPNPEWARINLPESITLAEPLGCRSGQPGVTVGW